MPAACALVREGSALLAQSGIATAPQDAEMLLAHVLGIERARLHTHPGRPVAEGEAATFRTLLERRAAREPLQHLVGEQEFWSLTFRVSPDVLIPRPETEHVIECFLRLNARREPVVLDIGTGSGCLAVVVAREVPGARVVATDVSRAALAVARDNAARHGVGSRIDFLEGDLFEPLRGRGLEGAADFILSNPPYVGEAELPTLEPEVRDHEPRLALSPGVDPLATHRRLAIEARSFLRAGGHLIVEIGLGQAGPLRELYRDAPGLSLFDIRPDLAGIPRVLCAGARPCEGFRG